VTHPGTRRYVRHRVRIPVCARYDGLDRDLQTDDISYGGMFVATDAPAPVRELIRVELPGVRTASGAALRVCAVVAHVVEPGSPRRPGMGLQLYGISREDRVAWVTFVDAEAAKVPDRAPADSTPLIMDAIATGGVMPQVRLVPDDVAEINELYARLLTGRPVIVASGIALDAGELLHCELVHPSSRQSLALPLTVLRQVTTDRRPAFLVALDDPDGLRAARLWRFISTAERPASRDPLATPFTADELGVLDLLSA
jgi:hypothetical protein